MVDVKSSNTILMSKTILTGKIISFSNLMSKSRAKLFRVANIKAVSPFASKRYAIRAIYSIVPALYKTHGLRNRIAATVTRDGYGIVMPIVLALSFAYLCSVFSFASMVAVVILEFMDLTINSFYIFPAVITGKCYSYLRLRVGPMTRQEPPGLTPAIKRGKRQSTSTFAVDNRFIIGGRLVKGGCI